MCGNPACHSQRRGWNKCRTTKCQLLREWVNQKAVAAAASAAASRESLNPEKGLASSGGFSLCITQKLWIPLTVVTFTKEATTQTNGIDNRLCSTPSKPRPRMRKSRGCFKVTNWPWLQDRVLKKCLNQCFNIFILYLCFPLTDPLTSAPWPSPSIRMTGKGESHEKHSFHR